MAEDKIAVKVAEQEFERYADIWRIDYETSEMSEEDAESFGAQKKRIVRDEFFDRRDKKGGSIEFIEFFLQVRNRLLENPVLFFETAHIDCIVRHDLIENVPILGCHDIFVAL